MAKKRGGSILKFFQRNEVIAGLLVLNIILIVGNMLMVQGMSEPKASEWTPVDGPTANAFIMSYCPYGLQFLKAYVPVIELLGGKANVLVNFVSYAMHGEKELTENSRMYCIQYEQNDKFTDYLRCFVETDDPESCMTSTGVDAEAVDSCMTRLDEEFKISELYNDQSTWSGGRYPLYPVELELNSKYGVGGSPSFVLDGRAVSVTRSPEAIKQAICSAFETPPAECNVALSTTAESPGLGPVGSGGGTNAEAQCG